MQSVRKRNKVPIVSTESLGLQDIINQTMQQIQT